MKIDARTREVTLTEKEYKDLALTWKDIQRLAVIMDEEECDWNVKVWEKQEVAEQVLHRFNEERNKQS